MAKSMTGYGRGESLLEGKKIIIEIRSTNHRFCDVSLKIPRRFSPLESDIKKLISSRVTRGKIDLSMQFENSEEESYNFAINLPLAKALHKLLETLQQELNLSGEINLSTLLLFRDIIAPEKEAPNTPSDWDGISSA